MQKNSSANTVSLKEGLTQILRGHESACRKTFGGAQMDVLETITREVLKALKDGRKILICGNGGSAADAQHIAAEFVVRFRRERRSLPAIALTADTSVLTATANDYDFSDIFSRQVEGLGVEGDVLIGLSTSGRSSNVLKAIAVAKTRRLVTVGFSGGDGGELKTIADHCFTVESEKTAHIQEVYIAVLHALTETVEDVLFG